eukprot:1934609-Pyramimonas_sp.AAC.1
MGYRFYGPGFKEEAERDLRGICLPFKKMAYRESAPPWSLPMEIFRMMLLPTHRDPKYTDERCAFAQTAPSMEWLSRRVRGFIWAVRGGARIPQTWHRSWGCSIPKPAATSTGLRS